MPCTSSKLPLIGIGRSCVRSRDEKPTEESLGFNEVEVQGSYTSPCPLAR